MKYGTIGTSWITEAFIEGAKETGQYELLCVYSRDIKKAEDFGKKHGAVQFYDDLEKMCGSGIEAVYIASPNSLHAEQTMLFLKHKIHVICEKPMVTQSGQLDMLYETAKKEGVYFFEAFRHIHSFGFREIHKNLGMIGKIRCVNLQYNQYSSKYDAFKEGNIANVFDPAFDGGALMDLGVYPISFAAALWGKPQDCRYVKLPLKNGVDGAGAAILLYKDFLCNISFSKIVEGVAHNEIMGEEGSILVDKIVTLDQITLQLRNEQAINIPAYQKESKMKEEAKVFAEIIQNKDNAAFEKLLDISRNTHHIIQQLKTL